ncbi:MAG TPA: hypothetical protein VFW19_12675 [Allosphingosinicella sp.]|nr:hypothetical protein [Allosphingosinicella sp.]
MNKLLCSLIAAGAATLCVSAAPQPDDEARLASALANYQQSGPPTDCVNERELGNHRSVGHHTIIFDNGGIYRLWVNHPSGGCPNLNHGLTLVFRTPMDRLCRGDIAEVIDPVAHIPEGSCILGDFTPYRRVSRH